MIIGRKAGDQFDVFVFTVDIFRLGAFHTDIALIDTDDLRDAGAKQNFITQSMKLVNAQIEEDQLAGTKPEPLWYDETTDHQQRMQGLYMVLSNFLVDHADKL